MKQRCANLSNSLTHMYDLEKSLILQPVLQRTLEGPGMRLTSVLQSPRARGPSHTLSHQPRLTAKGWGEKQTVTQLTESFISAVAITNGARSAPPRPCRMPAMDPPSTSASRSNTPSCDVPYSETPPTAVSRHPKSDAWLRRTY